MLQHLSNISCRLSVGSESLVCSGVVLHVRRRSYKLHLRCTSRNSVFCTEAEELVPLGVQVHCLLVLMRHSSSLTV
jgi:hypothetical protein